MLQQVKYYVIFFNREKKFDRFLCSFFFRRRFPFTCVLFLTTAPPPICFFTVLLTADFCCLFGRLFLVATSINSGKLWTKYSFLIDLTADRTFFAKGNAKSPTTAAKDPKPLPLSCGPKIQARQLAGNSNTAFLELAEFQCYSNTTGSNKWEVVSRHQLIE